MAEITRYIPFSALFAVEWTSQPPASERFIRAFNGDTRTIDLSVYVDGDNLEFSTETTLPSWITLSSSGSLVLGPIGDVEDRVIDVVVRVTETVNNTYAEQTLTLSALARPTVDFQFDYEGSEGHAWEPVDVSSYAQNYTELLLDDAPSWLSMNGDFLTVTGILPSVSEDTLYEYDFVVRRTFPDGSVINSALGERFRVLDVDHNTWNMTRGRSQTYDVASGLTGIPDHNNWALTNPPDNVSINADTGVITSFPSHLQANITEINGTVGSGGQTFSVPVSLRAWRISDSELPVSHLISTFRSRDGSSGTELFTVSLLNPLTFEFPNTLQTTEITLSTGSDGLIDVSNLETAMASYDDVIAAITGFNDLGSVGNRDVPVVSGGWLAFAWKADAGSINYFTSPTGIRVGRADWKPSDFYASWANNVIQTAVYANTQAGALFSGGNNAASFHTMYGLFQRRETGSIPFIEAGDGNWYPDINSSNNSGTRYTVTGQHPGVSATLSSASGLDWLTVQGGMLSRNSLGTQPKLRIRLASCQRNDRANNTNENVAVFHGLYGVGFRTRKYDFAEMGILDMPSDESSADDIFDVLNRLEYNNAAVIGNQDLSQYR